MKIGALYSHLNGLEWLKVHKPALWDEVQESIESVDADVCKTKVSCEKTRKGRLLYAPTDMNKAFKANLEVRVWNEHRNTFYVAADEKSCVAFTRIRPKISTPRSPQQAMSRSNHTIRPIL